MFHGMKYVYAVYQEMNFSRAAKNLYISQPSLSAAVKKEEEELGFCIFDRSTSPIRLTEFGREYIRTVERILDVEQSFARYVSDLSGLKIGSLTIGGSNLFTSYLLPPLLSRFTGQYPMVTVSLVEGSTEELTEKLLAGKIDLLVENCQLDPEIYDSRFCCADQLMLTVPRRFAVNAQVRRYALTASQVRDGLHEHPEIPSVPLELFREEPFLLLKEGNDSRSRAEAICARHGFTLTPKLELEQQITAYNLSCYDMGVSFCGDLLIRRVPPRKELLFYKLDEGEASREVRFYYRRSRYLTRPVQEFLKMLG